MATTSTCWLLVCGISASLISALVLSLPTGNQAPNTVCKTEACTATAKIFHDSMDLSVKPCDNFYEFACGGFVKNRTIPQGAHLVSHFTDATLKQEEDTKVILDNYQVDPNKNDAVNNVVRLYRGCKAADKNTKMDILKEILNKFLGGWPLTSHNYTETGLDGPTIVAKINRELDQNFMLYPMVNANLANTSEYVFTILPSQPGMAAPGLSQIIRDPENRGKYAGLDYVALLRVIACTIDTNCSKNVHLYDNIKRLLDIIKPDGYPSPITNSMGEYSSLPNDVTGQLFKVAYDAEEIPPKAEDFLFTEAQLKARFPLVNWRKMLNTYLQNTSDVTDKDFRVMTVPDLINRKIEELTRYSEHDTALLLGFNLVEKWGPILSPEIRTILSNTNPDLLQMDECYKLATSSMGYAVGRLYNDKHVPHVDIEEVAEMVKEMKESFTNILQENTWLDSSTKINALKKINYMAAVVAESDWIRKDDVLNDLYKGTGLITESAFKTGFWKSKGIYFNNQISLLKKSVDRLQEWPIPDPVTTNALYYFMTNTVYFPSGIMQSPFFIRGRPRATNYGALGFIAAHEIVHGFDPTGRLRNERGELRDWWNVNSTNNFMTRAQCLIQQYSSIKEPSTGTYLYGAQTIGEDIADNGGLRTAFRAYKKNTGQDPALLEGLEQYTEDQLFFLSMALPWCAKIKPEFMQNLLWFDVHSPMMYRVQVPFQNSKEFSQAFNCPRNSFMNPDIKCEVW